MSTISDTPSAVVRTRRSRGPGISSWLMVLPAILVLIVFLVGPLWYLFAYSTGLRTFGKTKALAELGGEVTSFTLSLWRDFLAVDVEARVFGGFKLTAPSWVIALVLVLLIVGTVFGGRISKDHGVLLSGICAVLLLVPFMTVPWKDGQARLVELWSESTFLRLFFRSVSLAMTSSVFAVLFAFPIAYFLAFAITKSKYTWILIVITPFLTSYLLRVFAWTIILGDEGLVNSALGQIGIGRQDWLLYTPFTVIVVLTYAWVPFICLPIFIALDNIDRRLLEAATDLGASRRVAFFRITLPIAAPGIVAAFLFVFIPSIGEYVTPSLVGGTKGYMFGNAIVSQFIGGALNWQTGSVLALFLVVVVLALTGATSRFLRAGGGTA